MARIRANLRLDRWGSRLKVDRLAMPAITVQHNRLSQITTVVKSESCLANWKVAMKSGRAVFEKWNAVLGRRLANDVKTIIIQRTPNASQQRLTRAWQQTVLTSNFLLSYTCYRQTWIKQFTEHAIVSCVCACVLYMRVYTFASTFCTVVRLDVDITDIIIVQEVYQI